MIDSLNLIFDFLWFRITLLPVIRNHVLGGVKYITILDLC